MDGQPVTGITPEEANAFMEAIDKLDGFKRFIMVLPMEMAFIGICASMAWQGQTDKALTALAAVFGIMVGYFFGKADQPANIGK